MPSKEVISRRMEEFADMMDMDLDSEEARNDEQLCFIQENLLYEPEYGNASCGSALKLVKERLPEVDKKLFLLLTDGGLSPASNRSAVLRNLTTKEYIRDDFLAKSDYAYSLGEAVCTQLQWTGEASIKNPSGCPGQWAGHRFDISTFDSISSDWKNVSDRAVHDLRQMGVYPKRDGKRAMFVKD